MNDKPPENKRDKISASDMELWKEMTLDVDRMPDAKYQDSDMEDSEVRISETPIIRETVIPAPKSSSALRSKSKEVDRRTLEKLRKGRINIDAKLDLHGYSQTAAYEALNNFVLSSYDRDHRCILVVTGKGRSSPGVLRQKVPHWLGEGRMGDVVLQFTHATQSDGGTGALYVYLRRNR